jgi:hypothetical protein
MLQPKQSPQLYNLLLDIGEALVVFFIIGFGAYLRFNHLRTYPDWYSDEGAFINISANLLNGKLQYFALRNSILLVGRPPLFMLLLAGLFAVFGVDIVVIRGLAAVCGILSIIFLYGLVREMVNRRTAIWSTIVLAIFPEAVAYNRFGFTYNLQAPLAVFCILCLWKYLHNRNSLWRSLAAMTAGLALASDYVGLILVALVLVAVLWVEKRVLIQTCLLTIIPLGVMLVYLLISAPQSALTDLAFSFGRAGNGIFGRLVSMVKIYAETIRQVGWVPSGLLGLLLIPDRKARMLVFSLTGGLLLFITSLVKPYGHGYFYLIPIFPWLAFGCGVLLERFVSNAYNIFAEMIKLVTDRIIHAINKIESQSDNFMRGITAAGVVALIVFSPLIWISNIDYQVFVVQSKAYQGSVQVIHLNKGSSKAKEAEALLQFLNTHVNRDDVVLASPHIAWGIHARSADFLQLLAYQGRNAIALPPLDHSRFVYDLSLAQVNFIVLDDLWRGWAVDNMPDLQGIVEHVKSWPQVYKAGEFIVYANPDR